MPKKDKFMPSEHPKKKGKGKKGKKKIRRIQAKKVIEFQPTIKNMINRRIRRLNIIRPEEIRPGPPFKRIKLK